MNPTATDENPTATELYNQFKLIEVNYAELLQACATEEQREQVRANYTQAWRNYNLAITLVFDTNNTHIAQLLTLLANGQQQIQNALASLQNISTALNTIASVVSIGSNLIKAVG